MKEILTSEKGRVVSVSARSGICFATTMLSYTIRVDLPPPLLPSQDASIEVANNTSRAV